jgi:DNA-binding LacI/PurR family transcriptional regulator
LATRRLLDAGRCRIALLRWAQTNQSVEADPDLAVFRAVLAERGASFQPGWVRGDIHPNRPGSGWAEFREIWTARTERPDALIVADEVLMQSAVPAILATGTNVPQELQIVTHATRGSDTVYPFPVWALEVDPDEVAQQMGTMLLQRLRGQTPPQPTVLVSARWADSNTVPHPAEEAPV